MGFDFKYPSFGGFSLRDDEDEEKRQASLDALQDLYVERDPSVVIPDEPVQQPVAQPAAARPTFAQAFGARQQTPEDLALNSKWRQTEDAALDRSGYGQDQSYGWGEALRDIAPVLVGGALDLGFNKGQGLANVVVGGAQAAADQAKLRAGRQQQSFENAMAARHQRDTNQQFGFQQQVEARRAQQYDDQYNPDSANATAYRAALIKSGVDPAKLEGQSYNGMKALAIANKWDIKYSNSDRENEYAKGRAKSSKEGTIAAENENFDTKLGQQTQLAANTAQAGTQARINTELANQDATNQMAGNRAAATSKGSTIGTQEGKQETDQLIDASRVLAANPQLTAGDPRLVQQAYNRDPKGIDNKITGAGRSINIIDGFAHLLDRRDKLVNDVLEGRISPTAALKEQQAIASEWEGHKVEFAGSFQKIAGTQSDAGAAHAQGLVPDYKNPLARERLKGLWGTVNENVKANLGAVGITATPPSFLNGGDHGGEAAPKAVPTAPADAPKPRQPKKIKMRDPDGDIGYVDAADVEFYRSHNYTVVQ